MNWDRATVSKLGKDILIELFPLNPNFQIPQIGLNCHFRYHQNLIIKSWIFHVIKFIFWN